MHELDRAFSFAIDKEREARSFYEHWAARAEQPGVQGLFTQLAGMERGHEERLSRITAEQLMRDGAAPGDLKLTELMVDVKASADMSLQEAFVLAMKREQASADLYRGLADLGGAAGAVFAGLEREERRHKELLEREYDAVFLADN